MRRLIFMLIAILIGCGCSTTRSVKRMGIGAAGGGAFGVVGGAVLSPNSESRALNSLVFGLSGALVGVAVAALTQPQDAEVNPETGSFKAREQQGGASARQFTVGVPVQSARELPAFLKERLQPVVIEEALETDSVGEDGTLHEPHKVYRIRRPAELFAKPVFEPKPVEKKDERR